MAPLTRNASGILRAIAKSKIKRILHWRVSAAPTALATAEIGNKKNLSKDNSFRKKMKLTYSYAPKIDTAQAKEIKKT